MVWLSWQRLCMTIYGNQPFMCNYTTVLHYLYMYLLSIDVYKRGLQRGNFLPFIAGYPQGRIIANALF